MKKTLIVLVLLLPTMLFSQKRDTTRIKEKYKPYDYFAQVAFSMFYAGSIPNQTFGLGMAMRFTRVTLLGMWGAGEYSIGKAPGPVYSNTGIYQIGQFGNVATGEIINYETREANTINIGFGYMVYRKNRFGISPFIGIGRTNVKSMSGRWIGATDTPTGVNVLGNYYVIDNMAFKERTKQELNIRAGVLFEKGILKFGLGYDSNPQGVLVLLGLGLHTSYR